MSPIPPFHPTQLSLFSGGEDAIDWINQFQIAMLDRGQGRSNSSRTEYFGLLMKSGSLAEAWFKNLDKETKDDYSDLRRAFKMEFKVPDRHHVRELRDLKLEDRDFGMMDEVQVGVMKHVVFARKAIELCYRIPKETMSMEIKRMIIFENMGEHIASIVNTFADPFDVINVLKLIKEFEEEDIVRIRDGLDEKEGGRKTPTPRSQTSNPNHLEETGMTSTSRIKAETPYRNHLDETEMASTTPTKAETSNPNHLHETKMASTTAFKTETSNSNHHEETGTASTTPIKAEHIHVEFFDDQDVVTIGSGFAEEEEKKRGVKTPTSEDPASISIHLKETGKAQTAPPKAEDVQVPLVEGTTSPVWSLCRAS